MVSESKTTACQATAAMNMKSTQNGHQERTTPHLHPGGFSFAELTKFITEHPNESP